MSTTPSPTPPAVPHDDSWDEHYADERDAAWLYRRLASADSNRERGELFGRLAEVEDRHTQRWEQLFSEAGRPLPKYDVSRRTRLLAACTELLLLDLSSRLSSALQDCGTKGDPVSPARRPRVGVILPGWILPCRTTIR